MTRQLDTKASRVSSFFSVLFDSKPERSPSEPDLTRRWVLTGAAAAAACVIVAGLPTDALADHRNDHHGDDHDSDDSRDRGHGRRRSRRHGRRRSNDAHGRRRSSGHSRRRSRNWRDDWDEEQCFWVGPIVVCD
jgi:hypothetical protein